MNDPEIIIEDRRIYRNEHGQIEVKYDKEPRAFYTYDDEEDFLADTRMFVKFAQLLGVEEFDAVIV